MNKTDSQTPTAESELKRSISRLSYIGMGHSRELDQSLENLRKLIKQDANQKHIQQSIDEISKQLITLEDDNNNEAAKTIETVQQNHPVNLLDQLLRNKLPKSLKAQLTKLKHQDLKNDAAKDATKVAQSIASIIEAYIAKLETRINTQADKTRTAGFFARLFGKKPNPSVTESTDIDTNLPEELKFSLLQMCDHLAAIDSYKKFAVKLNHKIEQLDSSQQLKEILELIAQTFIDVSGQEHQQFEKFLQSLSKRIDHVNDFINRTVVYGNAVKTESIQLNNAIEESVSAIKSNVEQSNSLQEVKHNLYHKLELIIEKVNCFKESQEKNQSQLSESLRQLKSQLVATEDETSRLREELSAQKIRAQIDSLTKLPNRYSYSERLTQEYHRWRRYRSPLSLAIGDIDYFKKINDNYGHSAGDQVLTQVAQFLQAGLRESDFIARYGGEEFVILLPETSLIDATKAINKLRTSIKQLVVNTSEGKVPVAMSFGVAEFENNDNPARVFKRADKAIYRAKQKGRDQVCCQRAEPAN